MGICIEARCYQLRLVTLMRSYESVERVPSPSTVHILAEFGNPSIEFDRLISLASSIIMYVMRIVRQARQSICHLLG